MTLTEIKQTAIRTALINAIHSAQETQNEVVEKLNGMDDYNRKRYGRDWINKFEAAQQIIDEAFCELFNPKPVAA